MLKAIIKLMLKIKNKKISQLHRPYIIAEMSANHNGSLEKALKIVDAAADSGANALKLQTYTANTLTICLKPFDIRMSFLINRLIEFTDLYHPFK